MPAAPLLAALAVWAAAVPWLARAAGLELDVPARLEVIDHVVPGAVALVCAIALAATGPGSVRRLVAAGAAALAGLWISASHATLIPEAIDGVTGWGPALVHLSAGPPIVALALWVVLREP